MAPPSAYKDLTAQHVVKFVPVSVKEEDENMAPPNDIIAGREPIAEQSVKLQSVTVSVPVELMYIAPPRD